ncbi:serine hydroxymethyltransferase [Thermoproteota archaeon]
MKSIDVNNEIRSLVEKHHKLRGSCINLGASENVTSPSLRRIVVSDLMHRYSEWEENDIEHRWNQGGEYIIEIEKITRDLSQKLFNAKYAEIRPISGQTAILAAISAFAQPGTIVLETSMDEGGHGWCAFASSMTWDSNAIGEYGGGNKIVNYAPDFLPFDFENFNIDVDASVKKIKNVKPSLILLGSSYLLFPHPVKDICEAANDVNAKVAYDGAHVMGLIAGKQWPNPLEDGADVLTGSTHKTIPGPQRGLALTNDEDTLHKIGNALFPAYLTNHHPMNSAALAIVLGELLEFGEDYSKQIVNNSKALGQALSQAGFKVIGENNGYTESHTLLPITSDKSEKAVKLLEKAHIIADMMDFSKANGIRIGTPEVTRVGMKEDDMEDIANFFKRVLIDHESPDKIAKDVIEYTKGFQNLHYSVDNGKKAYQFYSF